MLNKVEELVTMLQARYNVSNTPVPKDDPSQFQRVLWGIWGLHGGGCPRAEVEFCANKLCLVSGADFGQVYDFIFGRVHAAS